MSKRIQHTATLTKGMVVGCDGLRGITVGKIIDWHLEPTAGIQIRVEEKGIYHPLDLEKADRFAGLESTWPAYRVAPVQNFNPEAQKWVPCRWKE